MQIRISDKSALGELVSLIGSIGLKKQSQERKYLLVQVYEYLLKRFAESEGKNTGNFYTPQSIAKLVAEMLEPHKGSIYDGCCGTGEMFIQSEKFIKEHHSKNANQSFYGQDVKRATVKLAKMNLGIHGIDVNLHWGDIFTNDCLPALQADFILARPPFNMRDWQGDELYDDKRWKYGVPPKENANYAWLQHFISKLSPSGTAGIVLAAGSMYSKIGKEGEIRRKIN
ncbi:MAG: N-6 DNA methylase [Segetibacter sp.]